MITLVKHNYVGQEYGTTEHNGVLSLEAMLANTEELLRKQ